MQNKQQKSWSKDWEQMTSVAWSGTATYSNVDRDVSILLKLERVFESLILIGTEFQSHTPD